MAQNPQAALVRKNPTPVQATQKPQRTLESLLTGEQFMLKLRSLLPSYLPAKTFVQIVCTQLRKVPKLAKCTQPSFFACLQECAEMGLSPNGRHAYLIPFEDRNKKTVECTLIFGYKGLAKLARKFGGVTSIYTEIWCDGDELTNDTGEIHHIINYRAPRNADTMLGVVCVVTGKDGLREGIVVPKCDIDAIRDRAQSYRRAMAYGRDCPWTTDYFEMAKKTAFRRLCKWLDLSPEFEIAVEKDDADYINVDSVDTDIPKPAAVKQIVGNAPKPLPKPTPEQPELIPEAEAQPQPQPEAVKVRTSIDEEEETDEGSVF